MNKIKKILITIYNSFFWFWLKPTRWSLNYGAYKENKLIIKLLQHLGIDNNSKILDVGCGYGRILKLLLNEGYNCTGVEINEQIINTNKLNNLPCIAPHELQKDQMFDVIIMSHLVEHFEPQSLLRFLEYYLKHLKVNGFLIILTPYYNKQFYLDFDHIRPYHPYSFQMIFQEKKQIQYYAEHTLNMVKVKNIRIPFNHRTIHYSTQNGGVLKKGVIDILGIITYFISFKIIGITNSWIGIFKKENDK